MLTVGARHSSMQIEVNDRFLSNGNDSGSLSYRRTTPILAALYKITRAKRLRQ
jgi:iron complex outermembrane receptor protein